MYQPALWDFGDTLFLSPYADQGDAIWRSKDGITWRRARIPGLGSPAATDTFTVVNAIARGPGGYVAVGRRDDDSTNISEGRVWTSRDGVAWNGQAPEGVSGNSEGVPGTQELRLIGAADDGYVAFGWGQDGNMAWTSTDGMRWQAAKDPGLRRIALTAVAVLRSKETSWCSPCPATHRRHRSRSTAGLRSASGDRSTPSTPDGVSAPPPWPGRVPR